MSEANGATPVVQEGTTPPAAPTATPPANANQGETVTLGKEEAEQLKRDAARAREAQSKADRYDRLMRQGGGHFKAQSAPVPPTEDEQKSAAEAEDRKAEKGLLGLAADPAFREALDADPTLRTLLTTNPLAILPAYAPDALDAEDAIALVKEKLAIRVEEIKKSKATPPAPGQTPPATPPAPPAGGVNPPAATTPDAAYQAAKSLPNTERALAGMIKVGLNKMGGK